MDKRTAADCFERWKERFGSERKAIVAEIAHASEDVTTPTSSNQMTTRGVKRLASASVSSPSTAFTSDARKRLRHGSLSDAVRRTAKKRADAAQKAQGKSAFTDRFHNTYLASHTKAMQRKSSSVVHETHNQFSKLPRLAPAELSRLKAEKDLKNTQDIAMARKIQDEQIRQNILQREQTQRAGAGLPVRGTIFSRQNILLKVSFSPFNPKQRNNSNSNSNKASNLQDRKHKRLNPLSNLKRNSLPISKWRKYNSFRPNNNNARIKTSVQMLLLRSPPIVLLDRQGLQTPGQSIVNRHRSCNRREPCKFPCNCKRVDKRTWSV